MPRNTKLEPPLVKQRIAALARPDAVDVNLLSAFPDSLPAGSLVSLNDLRDLRGAGKVFPPAMVKGKKIEVTIIRMKAAGSYVDGKFPY